MLELAGACVENSAMQEVSSVATQRISDLCSGISSFGKVQV